MADDQGKGAGKQALAPDVLAARAAEQRERDAAALLAGREYARFGATSLLPARAPARTRVRAPSYRTAPTATTTVTSYFWGARFVMHFVLLGRLHQQKFPF